jgi:hypothetical protein
VAAGFDHENVNNVVGCVWYNAAYLGWRVFKKVAEILGIFKKFDEDTVARNSVMVARINIITSLVRRTTLHRHLVIKGVDFGLWVVEKGGGRRKCQDLEKRPDFEFSWTLVGKFQVWWLGWRLGL